ncbi:MAG: hypothetical protein ACLGGU_05140 [Gammaproteobacteria bacterium]
MQPFTAPQTGALLLDGAPVPEASIAEMFSIQYRMRIIPPGEQAWII